MSAMQSETLGPKDSDCGTVKCIHVQLTKENSNHFMYRYIKVGTAYICLTPDTIDKYIGKTVEMRSPMYCLGVGKEKCICNKCAGDFFYKLGKENIGLIPGKMAGTLSNLNLQKFHDNVVKVKKLDVNDMYI